MHSTPILTLVLNPIQKWGITNQQLIQSYKHCLQDSKFRFLGYKTNQHDFVTHEPSAETLNTSKYFNLYSEYSNGDLDTQNLYNVLTAYGFTHDLILTEMPDHTLQILQNNLAETLDIQPRNITLTYIETNITLLSHRDSDYFDKNSCIHPYMERIKQAMITESALNWNLIGAESRFRITDGPNKYTNRGQGELSFFNPCGYKHGTSYNTYRLTLSARFFDIEYGDLWERINSNLTVLEINPKN